jgi:uncharacterized protein YdhG (YjbR/CyaY superfamily)
MYFLEFPRAGKAFLAETRRTQRKTLGLRRALGATIITGNRERPLPFVLRGAQEEFMRSSAVTPKNVDEYIASFSPDVQTILERIRLTIRQAAPDAQETISYRIPAFTLDGILVYFAAFKKHIGLYPPVRGDAKLQKAISTYAGEKGNLQFPLHQPIPYGLIERIVKLRVKQNLAKARTSRKG